jgi:hypothetical protein
MASEKRYAVKTRYVFEGHFYIKAMNKAQAREYAEKHCGLVLGRSIHSTLPADVVDWEFPIHPEELIRKISLAKEA